VTQFEVLYRQLPGEARDYHEKNSSLYSWSPGKDLNPRLIEYDAQILIPRRRRSVCALNRTLNMLILIIFDKILLRIVTHVMQNFFKNIIRII
jgi:hypothetical protein